MKSTSHKSQQANELNNSIPTIPQFSLIRKFLVWLTTIFSTCWRLIVQTIRGNLISNHLSVLSKECLVKKDHRELELKKQVKFGIETKEVVNANMKHPFVVIASLGQLCANSGKMLVQRALGTDLNFSWLCYYWVQ